MPTPPPLDAHRLSQLSTLIEAALRGMFAGTPNRDGMLPSPAMLQLCLLEQLGEGYEPEDHRRFVLFAAPLMRGIVLEYAGLGQRTNDALPDIADLAAALRRLEAHDPACGQLIDLHYFCGFNVSEAAATLRMPLEEAIRRLRFARAWLQVRGLLR